MKYLKILLIEYTFELTHDFFVDFQPNRPPEWQKNK